VKVRLPSDDELRRRDALYTAEGLLHPKDGCRFAEKKRNAGPGRFWVEPTSAPPAR